MRTKTLPIMLLASAGLVGTCTNSLPTDEPGSASAGSDFAAEVGVGIGAAADTAGPSTLIEPLDPLGVVANPGPDTAAIAAEFDGQVPSEWGLDVTGVQVSQSSEGVALTLDACGGPGGSKVDQDLIDGLISRNVPATLFVNSRWIDENRALTEQLAANPQFELANHGTAHLPLSVTGASAYGIGGTGSAAEVVAEVWGNHVLLTQITGKPPRFFPSGTAHYDDVAVRIVNALGEQVVGFNVNVDAGATASAESVFQALVSAGPGSIIIAHFNQPGGQTAEGMLPAIDQMRDSGVAFTLLG